MVGRFTLRTENKYFEDPMLLEFQVAFTDRDVGTVICGSLINPMEFTVGNTLDTVYKTFQATLNELIENGLIEVSITDKGKQYIKDDEIGSN